MDASLSPQSAASSHLSSVSGLGMFHNWRNSFKSPLFALLDLVDNAVDASLDLQQGEGSFHVYSKHRTIYLENTCRLPVKPIHQVLNIYSSDKAKTSIGENGVGVKHASANLSDLSIIVIKNTDTIEVGIISYELQEENNFVFPSYRFSIDQRVEQLAEKVNEPYLARTLVHFGDGNVEVGLGKLWHIIENQCNDVAPIRFALILHKLRHEQTPESLLQQLAEELPKRYIHIQPGTDIKINNNPLQYQYWERRLADLTTYEVQMSKEELFTNTEKAEWGNGAYRLKIYLGFDKDRCKSATEMSSAALYVYSRKFGRLVKKSEDCRQELGLSAGGTDFCQGLTILVDDQDGELPLTPTKQDLAFGNEKHGTVHRSNLVGWLGAMARTYYQFYKDKYGNKTSLTRSVSNASTVMLQNANSTTLLFGDFHKLQNPSGWKVARSKIVPISKDSIDIETGSGTLLILPEANQAPPKRKASRAAAPKRAKAKVGEEEEEESDVEEPSPKKQRTLEKEKQKLQKDLEATKSQLANEKAKVRELNLSVRRSSRGTKASQPTEPASTKEEDPVPNESKPVQEAYWRRRFLVQQQELQRTQDQLRVHQQELETAKLLLQEAQDYVRRLGG